jgi:hypothetical protein
VRRLREQCDLGLEIHDRAFEPSDVRFEAANDGPDGLELLADLAVRRHSDQLTAIRWDREGAVGSDRAAR